MDSKGGEASRLQSLEDAIKSLNSLSFFSRSCSLFVKSEYSCEIKRKSTHYFFRSFQLNNKGSSLESNT